MASLYHIDSNHVTWFLFVTIMLRFWTELEILVVPKSPSLCYLTMKFLTFLSRKQIYIYIYIYIYWQKKVHKKGPLISKFKVPTLLGNLTFRDACPDYLNVFLWFAWTQRSGNWYRFWWRGRSFHFQLHPFKKLSKVPFGISVFYPVNKLKGELLIWYFNFSMAISQNICYRHPVWPLIKHCIFCVTITLSRNTILTSHTSID